MRREKLAAVALICLAAAGCGERPQATPAPAPTPAASAPSAAPAKDVHSYSNPAEIRVRHVDLDWDVLFDQKILRGTAVLSLERRPEVARRRSSSTPATSRSRRSSRLPTGRRGPARPSRSALPTRSSARR